MSKNLCLTKGKLEFLLKQTPTHVTMQADPPAAYTAWCVENLGPRPERNPYLQARWDDEHTELTCHFQAIRDCMAEGYTWGRT